MDSHADSTAVQDPSLHQIVIVGGGAGGLELATRLGNKLGKRRRAQITLIDRKRAHLWKPKLHEIAAGSMDLNIAIRTLVCSHGEVRFWAGGGIVADSQLEEEYQETFDKAAALLKVLQQSATARARA